MAKKPKEDINQAAHRVVQTVIENAENPKVDKSKLRRVGSNAHPPKKDK